MTQQRSSIKIVDETERPDGSIESGTVSFESTVLTMAIFDAQRTAFEAVQAAIDGITIGRVVETKQGGLTTFVEFPIPATDPDAQVERRWKIIGRIDSAARGFKAWSRTIPAADITDKLPTEERLDPASTAFTDLKTAVEAYAKDDGDDIIVTRVILVGKT